MSNKEAEEVNLFQLMLDQADGIDFSDPSLPPDDQIDPTSLKVQGLEVSKLFCVVYWALLHSEDEEGITAGLDMMNMSQAKKLLMAHSYSTSSQALARGSRKT